MQSVKRRILLRRKVSEETGLGGRTIYDRMEDGTFPRSLQLTSRRVGWLADEIDLWLDMRIAHRDGNLDNWLAVKSAENGGQLPSWVTASVAQLRGNVTSLQPPPATS